LVNEEIDRLRTLWSKSVNSPDENMVDETLGSEAAHALDLFDRIQLRERAASRFDQSIAFRGCPASLRPFM